MMPVLLRGKEAEEWVGLCGLIRLIGTELEGRIEYGADGFPANFPSQSGPISALLQGRRNYPVPDRRFFGFHSL